MSISVAISLFTVVFALANLSMYVALSRLADAIRERDREKPNAR